MYRLKSIAILCMIHSLFSCSKEEINIINDEISFHYGLIQRNPILLENEFTKIDLYSPTITMKDSISNIAVIKNTIFESGYMGFQYGYGDIISLDNGQLMVVCERSKSLDDFDPGQLIIARSKDNGSTWSNIQEIKNEALNFINVTHPSLINIGNGHILLFFGVKFSVERIDIRYKESFDNGITWSKDKLVGSNDEQGYQIINNARVVYENNRIIIPVSIPHNNNAIYESIEGLSVFYYYSDNLGITWNKSKCYSSNLSLLEPGITYLDENELLMNIRTNIGYTLFARSYNNGNSWQFVTSDIKSTSSPQTIFKINNSDNLIMLYNNSSKGGNRNSLSIALSKNKGHSWLNLGIIEENSNKDYHLSYPGIYVKDENIYIIYNGYYNKKSSLKIAKIKLSNTI